MEIGGDHPIHEMDSSDARVDGCKCARRMDSNVFLGGSDLQAEACRRKAGRRAKAGSLAEEPSHGVVRGGLGGSDTGIPHGCFSFLCSGGMAGAASRGTTTPQSKTAQTQELQVVLLSHIGEQHPEMPSMGS